MATSRLERYLDYGLKVEGLDDSQIQTMKNLFNALPKKDQYRLESAMPQKSEGYYKYIYDKAVKARSQSTLYRLGMSDGGDKLIDNIYKGLNKYNHDVVYNQPVPPFGKHKASLPDLIYNSEYFKLNPEGEDYSKLKDYGQTLKDPGNAFSGDMSKLPSTMKDLLSVPQRIMFDFDKPYYDPSSDLKLPGKRAKGYRNVNEAVAMRFTEEVNKSLGIVKQEDVKQPQSKGLLAGYIEDQDKRSSLPKDVPSLGNVFSSLPSEKQKLLEDVFAHTPEPDRQSFSELIRAAAEPEKILQEQPSSPNITEEDTLSKGLGR